MTAHILFLKAQVRGYARRDGTLVRAHQRMTRNRRPVIHASDIRFDRFLPPSARGERSRHSRAEDAWLWFAEPDSADELTDMFGIHVAETDLPGGLPTVSYASYDADPIYDPEVMARILSDHADHPGVEVRGVQMREHGPKRTIFAIKDPSIIGPPAWRDVWDRPLPKSGR